MIQKLSIKNYKSLRNVELDCKKLNVFIGEPNSGKSNIIEALSLMSQGITKGENPQEISKEIFRYNNVGDLFFDFNINKPIEVTADEVGYRLKYAVRKDGVPENQFHFDVLPEVQADNPSLRIGHSGMILNTGMAIDTVFRFYEYKRLRSFAVNYSPHLSPPYGDNLPSLLLSNEEYRNWVEEFFESKGFSLTLRPAENGISMSKVVNKSIYSYPYQAISETLQRIVFYMLAIKSNKDSVLLFDEPESNTFPFYTGFMGEVIALDETNQFFLTTHNPYLLLKLIEKSKVEDINVCVVSMTKDYETKITVLNETQISEVLDLDSDAFLNLDRIVDAI